MQIAKAEHYAAVCKGMSYQPKNDWKQLNSALGRGKSKLTRSLTHERTTLTATRNCGLFPVIPVLTKVIESLRHLQLYDYLEAHKLKMK